ncbi:acetyl-CoA C-acetyltransferase [soil metagenome]
MQNDPIVIVSANRTPMGGLLGSLKDVTTPQLGAAAIQAAIKNAGIQADAVQEVIMGCVLPAGLGQAPARQAAIAAGIPLGAGATTVNKMCGSGMKAVMLAHDLICAGTNDIMVAGGMESMTQAPYLMLKGRTGYRLGHGQLIDHMFLDGLEDAYERGKLMGLFAENTAQLYKFTREAQDKFAITSVERAQKAAKEGCFAKEITPVTVKTAKDEFTVTEDDGPKTANIAKIPTLKPAFSKDGTVTAANSSSISDGAAALILMRRSMADKLGLKPLAIIRAHATHSQEPQWFTTAPVGAIKSVLEKTHWTSKEVDLYEINEAFAVVTMAAMHDLDLPHDKVNIHGGACVLGHPIGASGARVLTTLIHNLERYQLKRGIATLCIGGGEATAMAVERV